MENQLVEWFSTFKTYYGGIITPKTETDAKKLEEHSKHNTSELSIGLEMNSRLDSIKSDNTGIGCGSLIASPILSDEEVIATCSRSSNRRKRPSIKYQQVTICRLTPLFQIATLSKNVYFRHQCVFHVHQHRNGKNSHY